MWAWVSTYTILKTTKSSQQYPIKELPTISYHTTTTKPFQNFVNVQVSITLNHQTPIDEIVAFDFAHIHQYSHKVFFPGIIGPQNSRQYRHIRQTGVLLWQSVHKPAFYNSSQKCYYLSRRYGYNHHIGCL